MLLILVHWLIIIFVSYTIGFAARRMLVPVNHHNAVAITVLWGLFVISLISSLLMFFMPAGFFMLMLFFLAASAIQFFFREEIGKRLHLFRLLILGKRETTLAGLLLFALLAFSAQSSKINDDGYYYTQTVMWFTQEGFVNGISNVMLPLGLGSSWHSLQALFSFNFIEGLRFNDLNGLLVLVFFVHCLENGADRKDNRLLSVLTALVLLVSVPFLSAASPDLPVVIFTVMAFYSMVRPFGSRAVTDVLVLAAFGASVKLSAIALVLLALALIVWGVQQKWNVPREIYAVLFLTAVITLSRNIYQTGYPLYPYPVLGVTGFSWTAPPELLGHYVAEIKYWGLTNEVYRGPLSEWKEPGIAETIRLLLSRGGIKGFINVLILVTFPLILLTIVRDVVQKVKSGMHFHATFLLHGIFVFNFIAWLILAPQYRFILPVYIFYLAWFMWTWMKFIPYEKVVSRAYLLPRVAIGLIFLVSLIPLSFGSYSRGSHVGSSDGLRLSTLVKPHVSYTFGGIDSLTVNGQTYYHTRGNRYCWDSPLPCLPDADYRFLREQGFDLHAVRSGGRWAFVLKAQGK